jgi:arginase
MGQPGFELIGVPTSAGAHGPGQEKAPLALRQAGLVEALRGAGLDLVDGGDLPVTRFQPDPGQRKQQSVGRVTEVAMQVAGRVQALRERGRIPLVLGGDCTITLGVISGLLRGMPRDLGLLYLDGDIDLNTPATTHSGILDGMGIAHVIGMADDALSAIGPRRPLLPDERILLFGYDPAEQEAIQLEALERRKMFCYPSTVVRDDPKGAAREALGKLERQAKRILLHFDVDVIDSTDVPLGDFPHFNAGLSLDDTMTCMSVFLTTPSLAAFVITEINPDHDPDGTLVRRFVQGLTAAWRPGARV